MLRRFMYASIAILVLALAFSLGAHVAASSSVDCIEVAHVRGNISLGEDITMVLVRNGTLVRIGVDGWSGSSTVMYQAPLPRGGAVADADWVDELNVFGSGVVVVYRDGEIWYRNEYGGQGWRPASYNGCPTTSAPDAAPTPATAAATLYPNPFNPSATIDYNVPATGRVALDVYDTPGRLVRTLVDGVVDAGAQSVVWDGRDQTGRQLPNGTYFYRLSLNGSEIESGKAVIVK